jgi:uncharacterized repeat protein (TIGR01451 family)
MSGWKALRGWARLVVVGAILLGLAVPIGALGQVIDEHELDPIRNIPLSCESIGSPGQVTTRSERNNLVHIANRCGLVGTDIEFQSRRDAEGNLHDYAFVGTIGGGLQIYDITHPLQPGYPLHVGTFNDTAYQGDVQVRGNRATITVDTGTSTSLCLTGQNNEGVDILRLNYDEDNAALGVPALDHFFPALVTCVANEPGGAHTNTLHPSGKWLAISNPSDYSVDVIDLGKLDATCTSTEPCDKLHTYRLADERFNEPGTCPAPNGGAPCIIVRRPPSQALGSSNSNVPNGSETFAECENEPPQSACGLFRPHDIFFSQDGKTMYVAALNSTFITNVSNVLNGGFSTRSIIPNIACPNKGFGGCGSSNAQGLNNVHNLELSHQSDTTADGKILVISDERGGGVTNTGCNTDTDPNTQTDSVIGGLHFWALRPMGHPRSQGATPANPKRLGAYFNPNPLIGPDELQDEIDALELDPENLFPHTERACTVHVFRIGGNGSSSPGPALAGYDGVSRLGPRVLSTGYYGAGLWELNIAAPTRFNNTDGHGTPEEPRSTWANTRRWNIQAGAEAWSGKEYKGFHYTGDMLRGFDVFACGTSILAAGPCPADPVVALIKTGPATAKRGAIVQYTIEYDNGGPAASHNAKIVDSLPAKTSFVSASDGGTYNASARKVTWNLGTVPATVRDTVTLTLRVGSKATAGTVLVNKATFTGDLTYSNPAAATTTVVP